MNHQHAFHSASLFQPIFQPITQDAYITTSEQRQASFFFTHNPEYHMQTFWDAAFHNRLDLGV